MLFPYGISLFWQMKKADLDTTISDYIDTSACFINASGQSKENGLITGYRNYFGLPIAGKPDYPDKYSWAAVPAGYLSSSVYRACIGAFWTC